MSDFFHPVKRMLTVLALLIALATSCLAGFPLPARTLERIVSKKSTTLDYQDNTFPSSRQDGNIPAGYSIDIHNSIVNVLKVKLQLKKPKVKQVKANSAPQSVLIKNYMADIMCIPAFYSKSRHNISEFSLPFYFSGTRFAMCKNESSDSLTGPSGHSVLVKSGITCIEQLQKMNAANDLDINIQLDTNSITAFSELENGEYSALISSTVLLKGVIAQTPDPDDYGLSDIALSTPLPAGLLLPLHDREFKGSVDDTLPSLVISDESTALYRKWFRSSAPPKAINLDIPMSDSLKALMFAKKKISFGYEKYN